jgi:hypothetical protein
VSVRSGGAEFGSAGADLEASVSMGQGTIACGDEATQCAISPELVNTFPEDFAGRHREKLGGSSLEMEQNSLWMGPFRCSPNTGQAGGRSSQAAKSRLLPSGQTIEDTQSIDILDAGTNQRS